MSFILFMMDEEVLEPFINDDLTITDTTNSPV